MDKKFLIKFKDEVVRGPFTESEIDDMIYENVLIGEEQIKPYPEGQWIEIGKINHFYDAFLGAFEIQKNTDRDQKETFIDSPTQTDLKEQQASERTVIRTDEAKDKSEKDKDDEKSQQTQLYTREDVKEISGSLIKRKEGIIDPDQKSPIIPQAVIYSLDEDKKNKPSLMKMGILFGIFLILILAVIVFGSSKTPSNIININGTKFERTYVEIKLPSAESAEYNQKEAKKLRTEAVDLMQKDEITGYIKAVELLLRSFELDNTGNSTLSYLAYAYSRLYSVSKKDAEYLNALKAIIARSEKIDPNIQTLTMARVAYSNIQKDYGTAITSFNELLNTLKDPSKTSNDVLLVTAEAAVGSNDYNSAFQIVSKLNRLDEYKNPRSHFIEGIIRINNKELELATNAFKAALEINPNHFPSKVKLFELGKDASLNNIFNFIKTNYKNMSHDDVSICLYLLGNTMVQNSNVAKAKYFYEKALDFSNDNVKAMIAYEQLGGNISKYRKENLTGSVPTAETSTFLMRGDELFHLQKYRDASLQYRMATSLDPQNALSWYKLGESYRMTYEYAKAVDSYLESLKLDKLNVLSMVKLARTQIELYKFKDAADNLKKAQDIDPDNPDVLFTIGYLNDKRNSEADAVKFYHRAVANDFSHVDSNFALGKKTYDHERYEEAKLSFEKVLAKQPDNFEAYIYMTRILGKIDHISKAERYVENLEKTFPEIAEISTGLAQAYMDIANYDAAEKELKKALKKNKYSVPALKTYAELCEKLGRTKDALSYYETIAIIAPYYLDAVNQKANIYCSLGQLANCEQELTRLVQLSPQFPKAYYTLGKMYFKENQLENAEFALNNEIINNPYIRESYILLGDVYIKANKPQKALELFQRMLKANRKDPYALLGLASASYASRDFATADAYITQARHLDPSISRIYFLECKLYFDQKMYAESRNSCQEFLKRSPDDFDSPEAMEIIGKINK